MEKAKELPEYTTTILSFDAKPENSRFALFRRWKADYQTSFLEDFLLILLSLLACSSPPPAATGPNLLLITLCSWRVDHLSASNTPHFYAFAQSSIQFENAWANATFTDASHASLFTGLYPGHEGLLDFGNIINPDVHTLPEIVGLYGYRTQAFLDEKTHLHPGGLQAMARGFGRPIPAPSENIHGAVMRWQQEKPGPWLAWIHLRRAHVPYGDGPDFESHLLPPVASWLHQQSGAQGHRGDYAERQQILKALEAPEVRANLEWAYDQGIHAADAQLGEVLDGLQASGALRDTVVVVAGDHGEALGENGVMLHQGNLVPSVLRVPLLIHLPDGPARRESALVSLVDLLPTLSALSHSMPPAGLDGRDLSPLFSGGTVTEKPVLAQAMRLQGDDAHATLQTALVSPPYLLVSDVDSQQLWKQTETGWDRTDDPAEAAALKKQADDLGENSVWQTERPNLSTTVKEELRKNGYW